MPRHALVGPGGRGVLTLAVALVAALSLLPTLAQAATTAAEARPCGVDAAVGLARICGVEIDQDAFDLICDAHQASDTMSLTEVADLVHTLIGVKGQIWDVTFDELLWLDRPCIVHTTTSGCTECPGGHVTAVERLSSDWAITVGPGARSLVSARQLRETYRGRSLLTSAPPFAIPGGPHLVLDSYVSDLGAVLAGQTRAVRLVLRNEGSQPLTGLTIACDADLALQHAPTVLAPGDSAPVDLTYCPIHHPIAPSESRTSFLVISSNDPIRPSLSAAIRSTVVEPVVVSSPFVYFPRVVPGATSERTISVGCRPPVEIVGLTSSNPAVSAEVARTGETPSSTEYQVKITARGDSFPLGLVEVPLDLKLKGVASQGAQLIARLRVCAVVPDAAGAPIVR